MDPILTEEVAQRAKHLAFADANGVEIPQTRVPVVKFDSTNALTNGDGIIPVHWPEVKQIVLFDEHGSPIYAKPFELPREILAVLNVGWLNLPVGEQADV